MSIIITHLELFLVFQNSWTKNAVYIENGFQCITGFSGRTDKISRLNSKLCGQDELVWDVPESGNVRSDVKMGLDLTGSGQATSL